MYIDHKEISWELRTDIQGVPVQVKYKDKYIYIGSSYTIGLDLSYNISRIMFHTIKHKLSNNIDKVIYTNWFK